jgi:hypothetical protein
MEKVNEFRQRAGECRTLAVTAKTAEIREHYQQLAQVWDQLADERLAFFLEQDERRKKEPKE